MKNNSNIENINTGKESETTITNESLDTLQSSKSMISCKAHIDKAFILIRQNKKDEARKEIDEAYLIDENYAYIYLAKLFLKFNFKSMEDLKRKANNGVVTSSFFKAAYELGEESLKNELNEIMEDVEYKEVEFNIESADLEQLLKHLRYQKERKVDYTYTISLILSFLYRQFRFLDREYIDENMIKDNFIAILKKTESNFQYYMDTLYHFDDISDIKDIVNQAIKEHRNVLNYLLLVLKSLVINTVEEEKLIEIKEYIEITYTNHEADEILDLIAPKIKHKYTFNLKKSLIIGGIAFLAVVCFISLGVGISQIAVTGPITINGVTYVPNNRDGYTISSYDFLSDTVIFEDTINGKDVNKIENNIFKESEIESIVNFPDAIQEIPDGCFESCQKLETFDIGEDSNLRVISQDAFKDCLTLSSIYLPKNMEYIGDGAFSNTPELIYIENDSEKVFDGERAGLTEREIVVDVKGNGEEIINDTYYVWDTVQIEVGEWLTFDFIGYEINDNPEDTKIEFSEDGKYIEFSGNGYSEINAKGIYETSKEFIDPYGITYTLSEDKTYYTISSYDQTLNSMGSTVILYRSINSIPVKEVSETAFKGSNVQQIINLSAFIEEIKPETFKDCTNLTRIYFSEGPHHLKEIGNNAFENCTNLNDLNLPSTVEEIGDNAFLGCINLTNINSEYYFDLEECIRLGFETRDYSITYEDGRKVEGVYYSPLKYLDIDVELKDGYRPVILDENDNPFLLKDGETTYKFDYSNYKSLDLRVLYEPYLKEGEYSLDMQNVGLYQTGSDSIEIDLFPLVKEIETQIVYPNTNLTFKYEVDQDSTSSGIEYKFFGDSIYIYNFGSKGVKNIPFTAYLIGNHSKEEMLKSTVCYLRVEFY